MLFNVSDMTEMCRKYGYFRKHQTKLLKEKYDKFKNINTKDIEYCLCLMNLK